jgi:hypothetical protein
MKPSEAVKEKLRDTNQNHEGRERFDEPKKIVTPLQRMLMAVPYEHIFAFLHQSQIRFVISRQKKGFYVAKLFAEGMLEYSAISKESARSALTNALARFLTTEKRDFHEYLEPPQGQVK